jgi:hypothetical protein
MFRRKKPTDDDPFGHDSVGPDFGRAAPDLDPGGINYCEPPEDLYSDDPRYDYNSLPNHDIGLDYDEPPQTKKGLFQGLFGGKKHRKNDPEDFNYDM